MRITDAGTPRFLQADVLRATGLSEKTLQNYIAREHFEQYSSPGRGNRRMYSVTDVILLACMKELSDVNTPPSRSVSCGNHVRAWLKIELRRSKGEISGLPQTYFLFTWPSDDNPNDIRLQGSDPNELCERAAEYGYLAVVILNGKQIVLDTISRLFESSP